MSDRPEEEQLQLKAMRQALRNLRRGEGATTVEKPDSPAMVVTIGTAKPPKDVDPDEESFGYADDDDPEMPGVGPFERKHRR